MKQRPEETRADAIEVCANGRCFRVKNRWRFSYRVEIPAGDHGADKTIRPS
jgi:hypothetical protein